AASPGCTRFFPAAFATAFSAATSTSSLYEAPGRRSRSAAVNGPWQPPTLQPCAVKMRCWITSNVGTPPQAFCGFSSVASSQSGSTVAGVFFAPNLPGSSRSTVDGRNIAQARVLPMVTRMPLRCCGYVNSNGTCPSAIFSIRPCFRRTSFASDVPAGAVGLEYLYWPTVPAVTLQPGFWIPFGTVKPTFPSVPENRSTRTPPGEPDAGSSALPIAGNGRFLDLDMKVSVLRPDALNLSAILVALIGTSTAHATVVASHATTARTAATILMVPPCSKAERPDSAGLNQA